MAQSNPTIYSVIGKMPQYGLPNLSLFASYSNPDSCFSVLRRPSPLPPLFTMLKNGLPLLKIFETDIFSGPQKSFLTESQKETCLFRWIRLIVPFQSGHLFRLKSATPCWSEATLVLIDLLHKNQFESTLSFFIIEPPFRLIRWTL